MALEKLKSIVPVLLPGEQLTRPIAEYLQAGVALGMNVTDVADSQMETIRVVAEAA